jgi:capsule polysaccharide export protein KpsE/RkpR
MTELEKMLLSALEKLNSDHQRTAQALKTELSSLTKQVTVLSQQLTNEAKKTEDLTQQLAAFQTVYSRLTSR